MREKCGPLRAFQTLGLAWLLGGTPLDAACVNSQAPETVSWANMPIDRGTADDDACRLAAPDRDGFADNSACNVFVGGAMARIYHLEGFTAPDGSFLKANSIAALLPTTNGWVDLGAADDQSVLGAAQSAANQGAPVLAVWANPVSGELGPLRRLFPLHPTRAGAVPTARARRAGAVAPGVGHGADAARPLSGGSGTKCQVTITGAPAPAPAPSQVPPTMQITLLPGSFSDEVTTYSQATDQRWTGVDWDSFKLPDMTPRLIAPKIAGGTATWSASITLPTDRRSDPYALLIEEFETLAGENGTPTDRSPIFSAMISLYAWNSQ